MNRLPSDIIENIWSYDGRDSENKKNVIQELSNMIRWHSISSDTRIESYWYFIEELDRTSILTFCQFFFGRFGRGY